MIRGKIQLNLKVPVINRCHENPLESFTLSEQNRRTSGDLSLLLIKSGLGCQCSQARGRVMRCMIPFWIHLLAGIHHIRVLFVWLQFDKKIALLKILNPRQRRVGTSSVLLNTSSLVHYIYVCIIMECRILFLVSVSRLGSVYQLCS